MYFLVSKINFFYKFYYFQASFSEFQYFSMFYSKMKLMTDELLLLLLIHLVFIYYSPFELNLIKKYTAYWNKNYQSKFNWTLFFSSSLTKLQSQSHFVYKWRNNIGWYIQFRTCRFFDCVLQFRIKLKCIWKYLPYSWWLCLPLLLVVLFFIFLSI